jgi:hypothetical protein
MPYKLVSLFCKRCNKSFLTTKVRQQYCSRSCASLVKASQKRITYRLCCKNCSKEFECHEKRQVFCSRRCAGIYNNQNKQPLTPDQKSKISQSLKAYFQEHPEKVRRGEIAAESVARYTRGKYHTYPPDTIKKLSKRTITKIMRRMNLGCSRCGWKEDVSDIHHISGRKVENPDHHDNLTYICPNCHRLVHSGKLDASELITLTKFIGDRWKEHYYG